MSKKDEALKLVLEGAANYIDALGGDSRKYRQALAEESSGTEQPAQQQNQNYNICPTCGGMASDPIVPPSAWHQEPVAWILKPTMELLWPDEIEADTRNLAKWLNEEQTGPIDRQALARLLAHVVQMAEQPAQQQGWKLVPVEPTPEMLKAADDGDDEYTRRNFGPAVHRVMQGPYDHYIAMLNAAPQPAQHQEPVALITPLMEQQMFDDWCPYKGNPDPRTVWAAAIEAVNGLLLGASPPASKPLTDDRIWVLKNQFEKDAEMKIPEKPFRHVVRVIEAAHGITGEQK